jgi:putative ABC transport system permease protein
MRFCSNPFSYPNLDRIMTVWETLPRLRLERGGVSAPNFADFQAQNQSFEQLAAYRPWPVNITSADRPERVEVARVTAAFFRVFGMNARIGRTFMDTDEESLNDRIAILSEGFWRAHFAGTRDVLEKSISLAGQGVMPDEFDYPLATEIWVPHRRRRPTVIFVTHWSSAC